MSSVAFGGEERETSGRERKKWEGEEMEEKERKGREREKGGWKEVREKGEKERKK